MAIGSGSVPEAWIEGFYTMFGADDIDGAVADRASEGQFRVANEDLPGGRETICTEFGEVAGHRPRETHLVLVSWGVVMFEQEAVFDRHGMRDVDGRVASIGRADGERFTLESRMRVDLPMVFAPTRSSAGS